MQLILPSVLAQSEGPCMVIDVREYPEFAAGALPQARLVPLGGLAEASRAWDPQARTILVCKSGTRARKAAELLHARGFTDLVVLEGGTEAWIAAGLPVKRQAGPWSMERQVRAVAGALGLAGTLLGVLVNPWFLTVPGFVGAGLLFSGVTDTCMLATLLGKLPWNHPTNSCASGR
ncbi:MAG: rhodanese-like domain-containing protein [Terriglobales bacterium]